MQYFEDCSHTVVFSKMLLRRPEKSSGGNLRRKQTF